MIFLSHTPESPCWNGSCPILDSLLIVVPYLIATKQEKRMYELKLFIDYYLKYTVSIIWQRYILTLHLSHTNWLKVSTASLLTAGRSCKYASAHYAIKSYQSSSRCNPFSMPIIGMLILLYFICYTYSIILPCLKLKLLICQTGFRVTRVKFGRH